MANSAFTHDPQITVPGSSTDNAVVIFDGTAGTGFGNSTILVDSGGNGRIGITGDTDVIIVTANTVTVAGTLAATTLTGSGAGITALSAANITASGTLPALNGAALTALTAANITASGTLPALNGAALTALNGTQITSGTLPAARIADDSIVEAKLDVSNGPTNGQFLQAQSGEGGGLTWAAAGGALQSTVQAETRAAAAASGDVSYTGAGFTPTTIIVFAGGDGDDESISIMAGDDSAAENGLVVYAMSATTIIDGGRALIVDINNQAMTNTQDAVLKTLDSDGCTFTWSKQGSGSLAAFTILYLR